MLRRTHCVTPSLRCASTAALPTTAAIANAGAARAFLTSSGRPLLGATQLADMPASTTRKPRGFHRGPHKRMVSEREADWWRYVKRWELQMDGEWDALERFQHLPKPKKLLGNEACEIVWPYAVLLENVVKVHPFTKSIYVYYPQHTLSDSGAAAARLARRFARECLVPITFHNSQCYVEAELLLEHGDTAWIVVHCLDGRREIIRVDPAALSAAAAAAASSSSGGSDGGSGSGGAMTEDAQKQALLQSVLETASRLAASAASPRDLMLQLNQRPLQNAYLRIDYQWMGDTVEERQAHLVRWIDPDEGGTQPVVYDRAARLADWLNHDDKRAVHPGARQLLRRDSNRFVRAKAGALAGFFDRYSRLSSTYGTGASKLGGGK